MSIRMGSGCIQRRDERGKSCPVYNELFESLDEFGNSLIFGVTPFFRIAGHLLFTIFYNTIGDGLLDVVPVFFQLAVGLVQKTEVFFVFGQLLASHRAVRALLMPRSAQAAHHR